MGDSCRRWLREIGRVERVDFRRRVISPVVFVSLSVRVSLSAFRIWKLKALQTTAEVVMVRTPSSNFFP